MFNKGMKIGSDQNYDTTKVSVEGISAEDLAKIEKKNAKLIDIYKALGANENGMNKIDLAKAMDGFSSMDTDGDRKLSKKELDEGAKRFNEEHGTDIEGKDLKAFLKSVKNATKGDKKESAYGLAQREASSESMKGKLNNIQNQFEQIGEDKKETLLNGFQSEMDEPYIEDIKLQRAEDVAINEAKAKAVQNARMKAKTDAASQKPEETPAVSTETKGNVVLKREDGSFRTEEKNSDGSSIRSMNYDADGVPQNLEARTHDGKKVYTSKKFAANKLGLKDTFDKGNVYYDPKSKTHFQWNNETHRFDALDKEVRMVGPDGNSYDKNGLSPDGSHKLTKSGAVKRLSNGCERTAIYDEEGKHQALLEILKENNKTISFDKYTYDKNSNRTQSTHYFASGRKFRTTNHEYDKNGKLSKETTFDDEGKKLKTINYEDGKRTVTFFKENGDVESQKTSDIDDN